MALGLARALATATALLVLYFVAPLDRLDGVPVWVTLCVALVVLLGVSVWQVRAIIRALHPGVRGIEALSVTAPLFLLLFAASYYVMARDDAASFSPSVLSRTDTLYFTVTTFATVGYGDIVRGQRGRAPPRHVPDVPRPARAGLRHPDLRRRGPARATGARVGAGCRCVSPGAARRRAS